MARVHDLIEKVSDPALREALAAEIKKLEKNKKFGLVFEEHLPEAAPLPGVSVRAGMTVATVEQDGGALYRVVAVDGDKVKCVDEVSGAGAEFARDSVVAVAKFGEQNLASVDSLPRNRFTTLRRKPSRMTSDKRADLQ